MDPRAYGADHIGGVRRQTRNCRQIRAGNLARAATCNIIAPIQPPPELSQSPHANSARQNARIMKAPIGDAPVLDAIDRRILSELQNDGRMTNVELARRAGISAPPCLRRVRRLEEAGIIRGYHADTDPQQLGWEITFFAIVGLDSQRETVLAAFEQLVAGWPEVRECHMIRGGGDFLLKLVARDTAHENQLTQRLTGAPTVTRVQTLQTIRTSRNLAGVPL
jgi:DNA-binding Lrp family transcriptional regulator